MAPAAAVPEDGPTVDPPVAYCTPYCTPDTDGAGTVPGLMGGAGGAGEPWAPNRRDEPRRGQPGEPAASATGLAATPRSAGPQHGGGGSNRAHRHSGRRGSGPSRGPARTRRNGTPALRPGAGMRPWRSRHRSASHIAARADRSATDGPGGGGATRPRPPLARLQVASPTGGATALGASARPVALLSLFDGLSTARVAVDEVLRAVGGRPLVASWFAEWDPCLREHVAACWGGGSKGRPARVHRDGRVGLGSGRRPWPASASRNIAAEDPAACSGGTSLPAA